MNDHKTLRGKNFDAEMQKIKIAHALQFIRRARMGSSYDGKICWKCSYYTRGLNSAQLQAVLDKLKEEGITYKVIDRKLVEQNDLR